MCARNQAISKIQIPQVEKSKASGELARPDSILPAKTTKMKTLVIHLHDPSTNFLISIYESIPRKTVVTGGITKNEVRWLIRHNERTLMLGHGCTFGLLSVGQFPSANGLIIDHTMVDFLRRGKQNLYIWCNADGFVGEHYLSGFHTGMFISEMDEAQDNGFAGITEKTIDESNFRFSWNIRRFIKEDVHTIYDKVKEGYGLVADHNPIAQFNLNRLYVR